MLFKLCISRNCLFSASVMSAAASPADTPAPYHFFFTSVSRIPNTAANSTPATGQITQELSQLFRVRLI